MNRRLLLASALTLALPALGIPNAASPAPSAQAPAAKKAAAAARPAEPAPVTPITVNGVTDIDPTKTSGNKNAPVVMEIFSDFQCPACKQLFTATTPKVIANYVETGKIYLVHRDFPLPMHAYSRVAASYSRAAAHIGKNDVVEVALFENQEKWEATGDVKSFVAAVLTPAEMKRVQAIVDSKALEPLIEKDRQIGQTYVINQTPTTWLHTKSGQAFPVVGYVNFDVLKNFLDQLVAQK